MGDFAEYRQPSIDEIPNRGKQARMRVDAENDPASRPGDADHFRDEFRRREDVVQDVEREDQPTPTVQTRRAR